MLLSKTGRTAQDLDLIHRILELPAVFIGSDAVMLSKRLGEMLGCGVIQFLRNLRDAQAFVCQIDFCRRHSGFLFFLLKGLAVIFFQEPFRLADTLPKSLCQVFQSNGLVMIEKGPFDDQGLTVNEIGGSKVLFRETVSLVIADNFYKTLL